MIESVVTYFMYFNQVYLLMYFDQAKKHHNGQNSLKGQNSGFEPI